MDLLKAEIERKKRQLESKNLVGPNKKYFKREELIKKHEEEYWSKYNKRHCDDDKDKMAGEGSSFQEKKGQQEDRILPRKEAIRRLRERNEPILLFGETEQEAFQRLRRLEVLEPEVQRGFRNDFQEAMEKVDQAYLDEILKTQDKRDQGKSVHDVKVEEEKVTLEEIKESAKYLDLKPSGQSALVIFTFIKFLLHQWGKKLNARSEADKMNVKGKTSAATYTQTMAYIRPLLKMLKNNSIPNDILSHLITITQHLLDKDYVKASDAYLQMAIGNAPWPIGVTMVGIHARTGREKIFSQNIAHVLNDETQRKYIQALKRLMTQCQLFFPTAPSRCVEYNAFS